MIEVRSKQLQHIIFFYFATAVDFQMDGQLLCSVTLGRCLCYFSNECYKCKSFADVHEGGSEIHINSHRYAHIKQWHSSVALGQILEEYQEWGMAMRLSSWSFHSAFNLNCHWCAMKLLLLRINLYYFIQHHLVLPST